ncbi:putative dehydrogenase [Bacillus mesophilus]|uniref:Gfo/Idh/MocA family oxidoreductase n=1 Tax=Bacillus mesophilus TaxID=1808955 RepID=A0A6M0QCV3_9BACI|nr:Gfo/Idh/MocA family oxidoreductase [Bacillus mesophilus]MBM7663456.1 putative dehydrogenase [Bacillus mesophilus]NEY74193.1 Gfo/Idh/MocA family oxidoreductase [Bacillus mesophilus]
MEHKIRVGIIGTGFGAKVHAPIMQTHPGFEVVAISSVHRGNLEVVKQETGVEKIYDNWQQMIKEEELDLLSVASAPYLHHEMVLEGFKEGLHILCEKPMAFDSIQSKEMLTARDQAGKFGLINFEFRFLPARRKVKEILESGNLGEVTHVTYRANFSSYKGLHANHRGWLGQKEFGGGMLGAIGSHMFDSLTWWMDDEVKEVSGQLPIHVQQVIRDGETEERTAEDSFQAVGTLRKGTSFTVELLSATRHRANMWKLEVYGTKGSLIMTDDQTVEVGMGEEPLSIVELLPVIEEPTELSPRALSYYQAFYPMLEHLYTTISNDSLAKNLPSFEHGHKVQLVLDAIRLSAKEGRKVTI